MKNFDSGVSFYSMGRAVINIAFPEDDICCARCPFCRSETDLKRYWCRLTNKMLYNPFPEGLPDGCPIIIEEEQDHE